MKTTFPLLVVLCIAGCAPDPTLLEFKDESVQVHALVLAGSDTASIIVLRGRRTSSINSIEYVDPVTDAMVRLVHAGDTVVLLRGRQCVRASLPGPFPDTTRLREGCYSAAIVGSIQAGETYELRIDVPGEAPIYGSARVPGAPVIQSPGAGAELQIDTTSTGFGRVLSPVLVRWAHPEPSRYVTLRLQADRAGCGIRIAQPGELGYRIAAVEAVGVDTATVGAIGSGCRTGDPARLMVTVFDTAYARYIRLARGDAMRWRDAAAGLTGALGVFGAAASAELPVILVPR
jgi:hypothetical protein